MAFDWYAYTPNRKYFKFFPYLLETQHLSVYAFMGIVNRKHTIALCTAILKEYIEHV